jgi:PAS domain S-box-containing protein
MFNEQQASAWKSEEMFRLLVSGVKNYAIVLLDTDGRVRSWNEGAEGIFGFSREEIIGQHLSKFYSEEECIAGKPGVQLRLARIAGRFNEVGWRVRKNGAQFHASIEITALRNKRGKLTGFGQLICDISVQKDAEERLRKSEEMFRLLVSGVEDYAIVMLNPAGEIVSWNEGLKRIKGYGAEEILGKHFSCFYQAEDIAAGKPQTELEIASKKGRVEVEGWRVRKDQSRFRAHVVISALHDQAGVLVGFGKVTRDISQQEAAEESLKQARDQAQEASRLKSQFLANMSHEIRTPMNGILGITDILIRSELTDKQRQILKTLRDVGASMLAVINDILDFSKVEAGKLSLQSEAFSLAELMDGIREMFAVEASKSENEFFVSISEATPRIVIGDSGRLRQVLINLIGNAIKFTRKGNVTLTVNVNVLSDDDVLADFRVIDNGIGISNEQIACLFEPFVQGDGATTRKYGGTGLGLSISKSLVELMQGQIGAESELGKGSTFWFRIPLKRATLSPETISKGAGIADGLEYDPVPSWQFRSDSAILIVEDNPVNKSVILMELSEFGLAATAVSNGKEAVAAVLSQHFDLILMDCQMPEMDGWQATNQIRALETNGKRVPIIALTAQALEGDRDKCLAAGMDDYLSKPIDFAKLERVLKRWLPLQEVINVDQDKFTISLLEPADNTSGENGSANILKRLQKKYGTVRSKRLVEIFIQSSDHLLISLADAIGRADGSDMRRCAHELVGSCMVLGAEAMGSTARQLEKMDPIDWQQAEALTGLLTTAFDQVKTELVVSS